MSNGIHDKSIERLFIKIDGIQSQMAKNDSQGAVMAERQIIFGRDLVHINEGMERNHHRLRIDNEKRDKRIDEVLQVIKDRISRIETYSKSPSIIGQFITRNKVWIFASMVAIIGVIGETGRMLYKMPPPH